MGVADGGAGLVVDRVVCMRSSDRSRVAVGIGSISPGRAWDPLSGHRPVKAGWWWLVSLQGVVFLVCAVAVVAEIVVAWWIIRGP